MVWRDARNGGDRLAPLTDRKGEEGGRISEQTNIVFAGGQTLAVEGELDQVAEALAPGSRETTGFNQLKGARGQWVLINREQVLYLEAVSE